MVEGFETEQAVAAYHPESWVNKLNALFIEAKYVSKANKLRSFLEVS